MTKVIEAEDLVGEFLGPNGKPQTLSQVLSAVGPGWSPLITDLFRELKTLGWEGRLLDIKEKYGGLRLYIAGATTREMEDRIELAEQLSFTVCEECGNDGDACWRGGWTKTLCKPCGRKWKDSI